MHRSSAFAVALALAGLSACSRTTGPAGAGPSTPQPAAAHQHGAEPAVAVAAAAAAVPMAEADTGDERVRHNKQFLISADSLAAQIAGGRIVVVHVGRTDSAYLAGHVPGARFLPLSAVATTVNGLANEFPPAETMANAFSSLVIREDQRIVLYGDDAGLLAARAWVALDLMGNGERSALLDGGLVSWRAGGRQVERGPVAVPMIHIPFRVNWQAQKLVDAAWVRAHLHDSTVVFVDARPADQFGGTEAPCQPNQPACVQIPEARRGHLPGAQNLFWMDALVSRENPVLKPMHELHHMLWQPAGVDAPHVSAVVTYCRTGVQASHAYFVARYIGYRDVRMYDGSFLEWSGLPAAEHPVSREAGAHQHH